MIFVWFLYFIILGYPPIPENSGKPTTISVSPGTPASANPTSPVDPVRRPKPDPVSPNEPAKSPSNVAAKGKKGLFS